MTWDSTGWNSEGEESPDFLPAQSPAEALTFWGGPYDGQDQLVRRGITELSFPVYSDPSDPHHVAYYERYHRDGRRFCYRGHT